VHKDGERQIEIVHASIVVRNESRNAEPESENESTGCENRLVFNAKAQRAAKAAKARVQLACLRNLLRTLRNFAAFALK
jgi:hypothetical protein